MFDGGSGFCEDAHCESVMVFCVILSRTVCVSPRPFREFVTVTAASLVRIFRELGGAFCEVAAVYCSWRESFAVLL